MPQMGRSDGGVFGSTDSDAPPKVERQQSDTPIKGQRGQRTGGNQPDDELTFPLSVKDSNRKKDIGPQYTYDRIRIHKGEEISVYAKEMDARFAVDPRLKVIVIVTAILPVAFFIMLLLPDNVFSQNNINLSVAWWAESLRENAKNLSAFFTQQAYSGMIGFKFWQYLVCMFAGAALGITGAIYQGTMRNAMASPTTLGVMSGATLGSCVYIVFFLTVGPLFTTAMTITDYNSQYATMSIFEYILATETQVIFSLLGSLIVVVLVLSIAHIAGHGKVSNVALIIAGQVFTVTISGAVQLIRYWLTFTGSEGGTEVANIATGTLARTFTALDFVLVVIPVTIGIAIIMGMRTRLNLLAFDEEEARTMGISTNRTRNITVGICTVMTAVVVAFCGMVGNVGFLVPHLVRKLVGPDFKYLVPAAGLTGALMVTLSNFVSNQVLMGLGMGSITSVIGFVVFIIMVFRQRGKGNADWI
jgi:iron complex transport system permease protein